MARQWYQGEHIEWGIRVSGFSKEEAAEQVGQPINEFRFDDPIPYIDYLSSKLHPLLASWAYNQAYDRGHASGEEEVERIFEEIVYSLAGVMKTVISESKK